MICTGDGLKTIRFDADGQPVPISHHDETCALAHAADTAAPVVAERLGAEPVDAVDRSPADPVRRSHGWRAHAPPRAPPLA